MKNVLVLLNLLFVLNCQSQQTHVYFFPGQGSDKRIFDSLEIDPSFTLHVIEYGTPEKNATMSSFARQLAQQIDTTQKFILVGVSLGGMICTELNELLNPEKTILISSAKNRNELPFRYKFQKAIPVYKLFPGSVLLAGAKILQPIVEPDRKKNSRTFKSMLGKKNSLYMKRTVNLIINWKKEANTKKIWQIHGTKDHTLPFRKIKSPDHIVKGGSHMMTLTRAKEISELLNRVLKE
jgi:pimeloyl-ACP methyl ester carboxylesterase